VTIRRARWPRTAVLAALAAVSFAACSGDADNNASSSSGGRLIATTRTEPFTFNRLISPRATEELISRLTQATLVRIDRPTGRIEPRLARSWTVSPDGLTWTLELEPGVVFSDGAPFTANDVVFSFRAAYDPRVNSGLAPALQVAGQPLTVRAFDADTVVITLPAPYGPGVAMLDSLPILPAHRLQQALDAGTLAEAWSLATPLDELAGLGPFVVHEFVPKQRLVFRRNPRFWRRDAAGVQLPYLDEIELQIEPDQNAEVLRLQSGQIDVMNDQVRSEDVAALQPLEKSGRIRLETAGVSASPDGLWFNLKNGAAATADRPWLGKREFRRAVSHAVDRRAFVDVVYLGAAEPIYGPITPAHGPWFLPDLPKTEFDPARARELLASIGLSDRDGDGLVDDARRRPARFAIVTQKGGIRERAATVIQESLRKVGLTVDVVAVDPATIGARLQAADYDAIYMGFNLDTLDPGRIAAYWLSSGGFHIWNPSQPKPETTWEASIDELFLKQSRTLDEAERRRLFADAQRLLAEHLPIIHFAAGKVMVATSARVRGTRLSVLLPPVLWNAEMLSVAGPASGR
jgi:peptide/nickel transport system substrate-binding protein